MRNDKPNVGGCIVAGIIAIAILAGVVMLLVGLMAAVDFLVAGWGLWQWIICLSVVYVIAGLLRPSQR